jgi:probable F420-dependent oxidoreductase
MKVRTGIQLHPQHCSYQQLAEAARKTDQMGFDTLWTWDHFYPLYGTRGAPLGEKLPPEAGDPPRRGDHFEGWTLLTAFACITEQVEIGMMVTCNSYRNPQLLADMFRTNDHVSGGRMILGLGSGWYDKDYQEYGYEFGTAVGRLKNLRRDLPLIKKRLSQLTPAPLRNPVPIIIGGGGEKMTLKMVAEHATMWNYFGTPEQMAHKISVLEKWCKEFDRNPDEIEKTVLMTDPSALEKLDEYLEVGVTHFILGLGTPFDFSQAEKLLAWQKEKNS